MTLALSAALKSYASGTKGQFTLCWDEGGQTESRATDWLDGPEFSGRLELPMGTDAQVIFRWQGEDADAAGADGQRQLAVRHGQELLHEPEKRQTGTVYPHRHRQQGGETVFVQEVTTDRNGINFGLVGTMTD